MNNNDKTDNNYEDLRLRKKQGGRHLVNGNTKWLDQFECCVRWYSILRKSKATADKYKTTLTLFCQHHKITPDNLIKLSEEQIEELIMKYIDYLVNTRIEIDGLSVSSAKQYLDGLKSFLPLHKKRIFWEIINKSFPDVQDQSDVRPYTQKELRTILRYADEREECMILIPVSAGLRVGALVECTIGSLEPLIIDKVNNTIRLGSLKLNGQDTGVALIKVHWNFRKWRYFSFISPECREAINNYLLLRSNFHEKLSIDSPLIRDVFCNFSPYTNHPAFIGTQAVNIQIRQLCTDHKIDTIRISPDHSLRKVFQSALINAGVPDSHRHILEGYVQGIELKHYYDMALSENHNEILVSYLTALDRLTLGEQYKLKKQVAQLEEQQKEQPKLDMMQRLITNNEIEMKAMQLQISQNQDMIQKMDHMGKEMFETIQTVMKIVANRKSVSAGGRAAALSALDYRYDDIRKLNLEKKT